MARKPRLEVEGGLYHLITRGVDRRDIFHSPEDHKKFLSMLAVQKEKLPFFLYAYCLMTNHVHLLIERMTQETGSGLLFEGPYKRYAAFMDNHDYSIYVTTAIHEMIHLAGYAWNDEFLVKVLKDMGEVKQTSKRDPSDDFGDVVKKYCGGNK